MLMCARGYVHATLHGQQGYLVNRFSYFLYSTLLWSFEINMVFVCMQIRCMHGFLCMRPCMWLLELYLLCMWAGDRVSACDNVTHVSAGVFVTVCALVIACVFGQCLKRRVVSEKVWIFRTQTSPIFRFFWTSHPCPRKRKSTLIQHSLVLESRSYTRQKNLCTTEKHLVNNNVSFIF